MTQPPPDQPPVDPPPFDPPTFDPPPFDPQFPPAQAPPPPIPPGPFQGGPPPGSYAAPPLPYPGAVPAPRSTGKTVAIIVAVVIGTMSLGVNVLPGACFGLLTMMGA